MASNEESKTEGDLADLVKTFESAAAFMSSNTKISLSNDQQLQLYGLFKQAQNADCRDPKPGIMNMVGRAKWDAWKQNEGMSQEKAMEVYISLVTGLCPGWLDNACNLLEASDDEDDRRGLKRDSGRDPGTMGVKVSVMSEEEGEEDAWTENQALFDLVSNNKVEEVRSALKSGADVNMKDDIGQTPLHFAVDRGHLEVAQILLEAGAEVDLKENDMGQTALMYAVTCEHEEIIKLLISHGADVNAVDVDGESVMGKAMTNAVRDLLQQQL